ncbi:MAG: hypothetical protein COY40_02715 [Alphaproteobacteria bacterium CG_4_10_14_0_8_um_filter_53_9]|nr:MAG: hypothetical protein COY40_02715 [Alphaproteobacteria bacterium CG_4_10_14_0_8_um_filter_53_9]
MRQFALFFIFVITGATIAMIVLDDGYRAGVADMATAAQACSVSGAEIRTSTEMRECIHKAQISLEYASLLD